MKIIVDTMPIKPNECFFSEWHPLPPICEETGYFKCKITSTSGIKSECNIKECPYLKEERSWEV